MTEKDKDALLEKYLSRDSQVRKEKDVRDNIASFKSEGVIKLIKSGDLPSTIIFSDGLSLLEFSSLMGNLDVSSYLIEHTVQEDSVKQHALELACANQYIELVELFVEHGVDINIQSNNGVDWLCVFSSIKNFNSDLFDFLMGNNLDLSVVNSQGYTPKKYLDELKSKVEKFGAIK